MYLSDTKGSLVIGLRQTFGSNYRVEEFRDLLVSIEYPNKPTDYPSIWVDFDPIGTLRNTGISQVEGIPTGSETLQQLYRWAFNGTASFTIVAMSSNERDRLFDELVSVMAFSGLDTNHRKFRNYVENNQFIGMNMNFDEIDQRGFNTGQGTPWGTDDMVYEATIALDVEGEFVATAAGEIGLVKLIETITWVEGGDVPSEASGWATPDPIPQPTYI